MSELKAFELKVGKNLETDSPLVVGVDNKWNSRIMSGEEVYLKPEADKEIAHHKYKRCLAMARLCRSCWAANIFIHEGPDRISMHYMKWEKRWLELAEKFKEAK